MNTAVLDTLPTAAPVKVPNSQQMVLDAFIAKRRNGVDRLTAGDVREHLEWVYAPRRFDKGWVTARLSELKDSALIEQLDETRLDPKTRKSSHLWRLPVLQMRLCN